MCNDIRYRPITDVFTNLTRGEWVSVFIVGFLSVWGRGCWVCCFFVGFFLCWCVLCVCVCAVSRVMCVCVCVCVLLYIRSYMKY